MSLTARILARSIGITKYNRSNRVSQALISSCARQRTNSPAFLTHRNDLHWSQQVSCMSSSSSSGVNGHDGKKKKRHVYKGRIKKSRDSKPSPRAKQQQRHHVAKKDESQANNNNKSVENKDTTTDGPPPTTIFTSGMAHLADASVMGTAGETVVLSTVVATTSNINEEANNAISMIPNKKKTNFTLDYRQRHHGVGNIPQASSRRDNGAPSNSEVLASRVIDRALRPLITSSTDNDVVHVTCSVEACNLFARGHAVALALNSASAALLQSNNIKEPVAAVCMAVMRDDNHLLVQDPTPQHISECKFEVLLAATSEKIVMLEVFAKPNQEQMEVTEIEEQELVQVLQVAMDTIQPILKSQQEFAETGNVESTISEPSDQDLCAELGLSVIPEDPELSNNSSQEIESMNHQDLMKQVLDEALVFCREALNDAPLRLFGYHHGTERNYGQHVSIHSNEIPLLSKAVRGKREHLVLQEIRRLVTDEFEPSNDKFEELVSTDEYLSSLSYSIHETLLKEALFESAALHGTRGDGRGTSTTNGTRTIRPLVATVPALPQVVHGSAIFGRGDTNVLCTATLGAPRDGLPIRDPYAAANTKEDPNTEKEPSSAILLNPFDDLPVGSLRYIRSQQAMISDFNTRNVKAEQERTGESGTLDEVQRAWLQYDFPPYCNGETPSGGGGRSASRRAIGHGALAERAILPILPPPSEFPYAIRLTSEVTSSNGSSSMASVCGGTLALLDAGVPITAPVAGVSVGLVTAKKKEETEKQHELLLDLTGTEDHYGGMDFKIAGTANGVTALQLDVKEPVSLDIIVEALELAKQGRRAILEEMSKLGESSSDGIITNLKPRAKLKESAPRVEVVRFDPLRKRDLIGPGGAVLRQLEDRFGVSLDLSQEGQCLLYGDNREMVARAKSAVMDLVADIEVGGIYEGTVIEIKDFGAVIELLRNKEGLLHVSELEESPEAKSSPQGNYGRVRSQLRVGQKIEVLCTAVDPVQGSIRLSRRKLLQQQGYRSYD